jgi:8-oxo-dGTP diphosphatase
LPIRTGRATARTLSSTHTLAGVKKEAMNVFRRLPDPVRRAVVHTATPSYTVGAVAVIRRADGRIAFIEQRHTPGWALPGGLARRREHPSEALVREIEEEIGIAVPVPLPVPYAAVNSNVRRVDVVYFLDAPAQPVVRTGDLEVLRAGWFALDALPQLTRPTAEILRAVRLL